MQLAILFLASLAASLGQAPLERSGPHFRIVSHHPEPRLADEALAVAEAAWPLALEVFALEDRPRTEPLVIHLYPDVASYEAAEAKLTKGAFKSNLAFSHFESQSSHIALQPPASPAALREFGLPTLTAYLLAHEAVHLVSYAHNPNAQDHPAWFAEGSAQHVGLRAIAVLERAASDTEEESDAPDPLEPLAEASILTCQKLLAGGKLPELTAILDMQPSGLGTRSDYAIAAEVYRLLLAKDPRGLAQAVTAIRQTAGGPDYADRLRAELVKVWAPKDFQQLQRSFSLFLGKEQRVWDEVIRSLERRGADYLQRAWSDKNALAFRADKILKTPGAIHGIVRVLPGPGQQMNLLLGRDERGFLSLAFAFGENVTLFRCDTGKQETWTVLGKAACASLVPDTDVAFRVQLKPEELVVFVAEEEVLRAPLQGRSAAGPWGLGAQKGTTGLWKSIQAYGARKE